MKNIGILGSTGSVGRQSLEVIRKHPDKFNIIFLSANQNVDLLIEQSKEFKPQYICIGDKDKSRKLKSSLDAINILIGENGLIELCTNNDCDIILNAIVGYNGLAPTLKIIESGIDLALSNKESIVQAGHLVMKSKEDKNINIFPVDSEHSALWQCLIGEDESTIKKLILTASGGPFRKLSKEKFNDITKEDALNHPNWDMGNKISIDSATMMNKGFELIEAYWLFEIPVNQIQIVVHPQSIIHSMVEFIDGSIKAQLSEPDMKIPIQFALSYPKRYEIKDIDFSIEKFSKLSFEEVDLDKFKCVKLAYNALQSENSYLTVLNVANDLLVSLFLKDKITFNMIPEYIERAMDKHYSINNPNISEIKKLTKWTKDFIERKINI